RSTITMGSRCGIRVVIGASATLFSKLIDDNGSHFSSGNHEVGHLHFAFHHGHAHHFLEDMYGGPEFLSGTGARKYFHVFNRPDIPDRRRQASEEVIITLVQGDGLGKVLDNRRFRQVARRVGQYVVGRNRKSGGNRFIAMLHQFVHEDKWWPLRNQVKQFIEGRE